MSTITSHAPLTPASRPTVSSITEAYRRTIQAKRRPIEVPPDRPRGGPLPFGLPRKRPSLHLHLPIASVTTLAPPYVLGSDSAVESSPPIVGPVAFSASHPEDGTIELMGQVYGEESDATVDGSYRVRTVTGFLLAGTHTVSPLSTATNAVVSAAVKATGTAIVFGGEGTGIGALGWVQLNTRVDVLVVGGSVHEGINDIYTHSSFMGGSGDTFARDGSVGVSLPVAAGDTLAIFIYAEAKLLAEKDKNIISVLNASSDSTVVLPGMLTFPSVTISLY